ncbi:conserved hypothetical protein [Candidatus Magnetomoraceae bacterium gMMP-1]
MRVKATKLENGFLIPMLDEFKNIKKKVITLEIKFVDQDNSKDDYSTLDQLVGMCETKVTDASINHDKIIYGVKK